MLQGEIVGIVFNEAIGVAWFAINRYESADPTAVVYAVDTASGKSLGSANLGMRASNVILQLDKKTGSVFASPVSMPETKVTSYLLTLRRTGVVSRRITGDGHISDAEFADKKLILGLESGQVECHDDEIPNNEWNSSNLGMYSVSAISVNGTICAIGHCGGNAVIADGSVDFIDLSNGNVERQLDVNGCVDSIAHVDTMTLVGMQDGRLIVDSGDITNTFRVPTNQGPAGIDSIFVIGPNVLLIMGQQIFKFRANDLRH